MRGRTFFSFSNYRLVCVPPGNPLYFVDVTEFLMGALKMTDMKLQDMKLADQVAGHEIAGHENDGPNSRA